MNSEKIDLTVIVLTYNESLHIKRCLDSVRHVAKRIVVVDSYSTDDTIELARRCGADTYQNKWVNHATQFQWGIDNTNIQTEWVMRLDADEYLEEKSISKLYQLEAMRSEVTGVVIKRKYFFWGQWIRFGGMHPLYHLKVWRRGCGKIESKWMDERVLLMSGKSIYLDVAIVDDNKNTISWWTDKHNSYATREVIDLLSMDYNLFSVEGGDAVSGSFQSTVKRFMKDKFYAKLPIFVRPMLYFFYRYFFLFGFLDGRAGVVFHFFHAFWYRALVDAKYSEVKKIIAKEKNPDVIRRILKEYSGFSV